MKARNSSLGRELLGLAIAAAFAPAHAQEADGSLTKPDSAVAAGMAVTTPNEQDRALFNQYTGMREGHQHLLLDLDYNRRDDATGTWTTLRGRNLGLESRDVGLTIERQGQWRFSANYDEIVRRDPRMANTGDTGVGTTTPTINLLPSPGSGADVDFKTRRQALGLSGSKWLARNLQLDVTFKNEDKDGARRWGRGFACPSGADPACPPGNQYGLLMVAEPIDWNTKQIDAKLNYFTDKLLLSAGYYGSFFTNANGTLRPTISGTTLVNPTGANGTPTTFTPSSELLRVLSLPMALPPDNQAHQLYVTGNYAFSEKVHSTFKLAYTHAVQDEDFFKMGLTDGPAGQPNLGGVLNTTLAQFGVAARPLPKLGLSANLRFEDRKDETPIALYNIEGVNTFTNGHISNKKVAGKGEATYQFTRTTRGAVGVDYELIDRGGVVSTDSVAGLTGIRQKTWETGYHGELRRSIGDKLTGAVAYFHSQRDGSSWLKPLALPATGVVEMTDTQIFNRTGIFPYSMTDRNRDKVRATADWMPAERVAFTLIAEGTRDHYGAPSTKGLLRGGTRLYSADASYVISEKWKASAYASWGDQLLEVAHSTGYDAAIRDRNTTIGIGVTGKPTGLLEVGAKASYSRDVTHYGLGYDVLASPTNVAQAAIGLPDVVYREGRINLYAQYALQKNSEVRLDVIHVVTRLDEWTWGYNGIPFIYSDNTTVTLNPDQHFNLVAARYIYHF